MTPVFDIVAGYLEGDLSLNQLKGWLLSHLGPMVEEEASHAARLAIHAQHLAMLVDDGEMDEEELRRTLAEEMRPLTPRPWT